VTEGSELDFSDNQHSLAELVFQGATELESSQQVGEEANNALMAWRHRSDLTSSGAALLQMPDCTAFSITYEGEASDYWPNESANELTEVLIRQFLYRDGICPLSDSSVRLICMKYQIMAMDGDEHVLICPYLTEAENISGIVVVCATKIMSKMAQSASKPVRPI
jgi:hypothetical protein